MRPPPDLREVVARQWQAVIGLVAAVPDDRYADPTRLPGWAVADLVAHLAGNPSYLADLVAAGGTGAGRHTASTYYDSSPDDAEEIAEAARAAASGKSPAQLRADLAEQTAAGTDLLWATALDAPLGFEGRAMTLADYLPSRCTESVVHSLDLAAATGVEPRLDRDALATVARTTLRTLAARHPGHTVEVRVPPFAAVQCVEGPRHTRGTPPNVVETDAVSWVELAAGRRSWDEAVSTGSVRASGERADLSAYLPVIS